MALLAVATAPAAAARPAGPPATTASTDPAAALVAARITFFTADDDKDFDTALNIQVLDPGGAVAGITNVPNIVFPNHTTNGPFPLQITPGFTAGILNNGSVRLAVTPVGNDTWRFSFRLDLDFADHTTVSVVGDNLTLSQDRRTLSVSMTTVGLVFVPSLRFLDIDGAGAKLRTVGLVLRNVDFKPDPLCNSIGTVKEQHPAANAQVPTGTPVDITIGTKPSNPCP
jgi:hypothetical protein